MQSGLQSGVGCKNIFDYTAIKYILYNQIYSYTLQSGEGPKEIEGKIEYILTPYKVG